MLKIHKKTTIKLQQLKFIEKVPTQVFPGCTE